MVVDYLLIPVSDSVPQPLSPITLSCHCSVSTRNSSEQGLYTGVIQWLYRAFIQWLYGGYTGVIQGLYRAQF